MASRPSSPRGVELPLGFGRVRRSKVKNSYNLRSWTNSNGRQADFIASCQLPRRIDDAQSCSRLTKQMASSWRHRVFFRKSSIKVSTPTHTLHRLSDFPSLCFGRHYLPEIQSNQYRQGGASSWTTFRQDLWTTGCFANFSEDLDKQNFLGQARWTEIRSNSTKSGPESIKRGPKSANIGQTCIKGGSFNCCFSFRKLKTGFQEPQDLYSKNDTICDAICRWTAKVLVIIRLKSNPTKMTS